MKETIRFTSTRKFAKYICEALDECEINYDTDPMNETLQLFAVHTTNRKDWYAAQGIETQAEYSKMMLNRKKETAHLPQHCLDRLGEEA